MPVKKRINSRTKGADGEREFSDALKAHGYQARRGQQFHGGPGSPDVVCDDLPEVHFEVKRVEKAAIWDWLDQAKRDCGGKVPVVAHRKNRKEWVVILPFDDFMNLFLSKGSTNG